MAISRPILIALIAAVVALVAFYATQGAREGAESSDAIAPVVPAEPAPSRETANRATDAKPGASASRAADERQARRRAAGMPPAVARALRRRDTVVLFFRGGGSADDRATGRAVAALRGRRGVAVFADRIGRLGRYRAVVGSLGIAQAPAVVIVDRRRSARVVEGYIDPKTLAQDVADAR